MRLPRRAARRLLPGALIAGALAALAAGSLELAARRPGVAGSEAGLMPERDPQPYVMFGRIGDVRWPPPPKPAGEYRIMLVGGSAVALGHPALPELLEAVFKREGFARVKVYNLGVVSQKSGQELAREVFDVVDGEPDLIVMYDGGNDIMDPFYLDPRPGYPMDFLTYENNPLLLHPGVYPEFSLLAFGSAWARRNFHGAFAERLLHLSALRRASGFGDDAWLQRIADVYVDHLLKSRVVAHAFGSRLVVVFQPLLYFKTPVGDGEKAWLYPIQGPADIRRRILAELRRPGPDSRLRFLDLSETFNGDGRDVFADYIHIRQEYQAALAERIYAALDVKNAAGRPSIRD